jgi:murein DD-endopeptidase MepM/ murein hydrolase activator NlpD
MRVPAGLRTGFVLPSAAAAALVVTATGASVAESAPTYFDLTGASAKAKAKDDAAAQFDRVESLQQREAQNAAAAARAATAVRIARNAERKAIARKKAHAAALKKAEAIRKAREKWVQPIQGAAFTSGFGWRWGRMHEGNDFGTPVGTPVRSMSTGTVIAAGFEGGYGNKVEIRYWDGTVSYFAHLSTISVSVGQEVSPGEIVAFSGNTGHSTGPHLHLEIHPGGGAAVDPAPWLHAHGLQ